MCAQHLDYWNAEPGFELTCPSCGWTGSTEPDFFEELAEYSCPGCDVTLALVPYPTADETRAAAAAGNPRAQAELVNVEARETRLERAKALELAEPAQLPEIHGNHLHIVWDIEDRDDEDRDDEEWTVIRCGDEVLWRELAYWEGYERFERVFEIVRARYGNRLVHVSTTLGASAWLYGDKISAPDVVRRLNESLGP